MKKLSSCLVIVVVLSLIFSGFMQFSAKRTYAQGDKYISDMQDKWIEYKCFEDKVGIDTTHNGSPMVIGGVTYTKGIGMHCLPENPTYLEINIEGSGYTHFSAEVGMQSYSASGDFLDWAQAMFSVYVDSKLVAQSPVMKFNDAAYKLVANVDGGKVLRLEMDNQSSHACDWSEWGEAKLMTKSLSSVELANKPVTAYVKDAELDLIGAVLKLTYTDGTAENQLVTADMVTGFDSSKTGKQTLTVTYKGHKQSFDVMVFDAAYDMMQLELASWSAYISKSTDENPQYVPGKNVAFGSTSPMWVADKQIDKGYGVHPNSADPAMLTFDIDGLGYEYLSVSAGKDRSCGDAVGLVMVRTSLAIQCDVLVDGNVVASSPSMFYGECYNFTVDVKNAKTVTFRTNDVDGIMCDSTDWINPTLYKSVVPAPITSDNNAWGCLIVLFISLSCSVLLKKKCILN